MGVSLLWRPTSSFPRHFVLSTGAKHSIITQSRTLPPPPNKCRWEPNIYSAEVEASSKVHVSRSCQTEALSVLLRSVSRIQHQKMSPFPPMKISATAPDVMVKIAKENSERLGTAGGAMGRLFGRLTQSTQRNIGKNIRGKRKKVLPRQESKRNNSLAIAITTATTDPEQASQN